MPSDEEMVAEDRRLRAEALATARSQTLTEGESVVDKAREIYNFLTGQEEDS